MIPVSGDRRSSTSIPSNISRTGCVGSRLSAATASSTVVGLCFSGRATMVSGYHAARAGRLGQSLQWGAAPLPFAALAGGGVHRRHDRLEVLLLLFIPALQLAELRLLGVPASVFLCALAAVHLALLQIYQPLVPESAANPGPVLPLLV